jgi:hypothetical protein
MSAPAPLGPPSSSKVSPKAAEAPAILWQCFICGSSELCGHREPELLAALLLRRPPERARSLRNATERTA